MRQVLLCIGLCVAVLPSPESEFDVSFGTKKPLGLQLDQGLKVIGFQRMRAGVLPPAEANGWIKVGDKLISVNEESTAGVPLHDVVRMIAKADLPKILRFSAKNGENRAVEMSRFESGLGNFTGATGTVDLYTDGIPAGRFPFVRALFGRNTSCSLARIVFARPASGCGVFENSPAELSDAIVVVERGSCPFTSKALNIQAADGYAMIVVNDRSGPLFRMPQSESDSNPVNIPAVVVSDLDGRAILRASQTHHHKPILARLAPDFPACDAPAKRRVKVQDAEEAAPVDEQAVDGTKSPFLSPEEAATVTQALESMLNPASWPASESARRKLFFRLSKAHHPDMPGGDAHRFQLLSEGYEAANRLYGSGGAGAGVQDGLFHTSEL